MTTNTTKNVPAIDATVSVGAPDPASAYAGLTLTFSNGERLTLTGADLSPEIRTQAMLHGLKQKLVDAAAISRNPETGRSATVEDKFRAVREVYTRLLSGEWNKTREGGSGSGGGLLLAALVKLYAGRKDEATIKAYLSGLDEKQQAALRADPRIAPIIAEIKAARDAKRASSVDVGELLAGLEGEE